MNIFLIRHGNAESITTALSDYNRKLTQNGEAVLKNAVRNWKKIIPSFDYIISSPLIRAKQTAEIIAVEYNLMDKLRTDEKIAGGSTTEDLIDLANSLNGENIAFVGHEPDLSNHLSKFISASGAFISFKKGTIAKISFSNRVMISRGVLDFIIPAEAFINK